MIHSYVKHVTPDTHEHTHTPSPAPHHQSALQLLKWCGEPVLPPQYFRYSFLLPQRLLDASALIDLFVLKAWFWDVLPMSNKNPHLKH